MTTNWQIFNTKYQTTNGLITQVTYGCTVTLEDVIDRTIGTLELVGDSSAESFVPYSQLTQETIVQWVKSLLGTAQVSSIETSLLNKVTAKKAAKDAETVKNGLPWGL